MELPVDVTERVRSLAAAGRKIEAIKELREGTGLGLAEAKAFVDRLPATGRLLPAPPPAELSEQARVRAERLVADGKYIQAVKEIRVDTGWSLKDAKEAMDRLRDAQGP